MTFTNGSGGCGVPRGVSLSAPLRSRTISFRFILSVALSLSLLAGPMALVSCGGSDPEPEKRSAKKRTSGKSSTRKKSSSSRKKSTASSRESSSSSRSSRGGSELEDEVADLLRQARDSGADAAFAAAYRKANGYYDDAREEEGSRAERKLKSAKSALTRLLSDFEELKGKKAELEKLMTEAEAARKSAEEAEAESLAAEDFKDAVDLLAAATKASAAASSATEIRKAADDFRNAADIFKDAASIAKENAGQAQLAQAEFEAMQRYKDQAQEQGANVAAIVDWAQAERNERQAKVDLDAGRFRAAIQGYQQATGSYLRALQATVSAEKMTELAKENAERTEEYLKQQNELALQRIEADKEDVAAKAETRRLALEAQRAEAATGFAPLGSGGESFQDAFASSNLSAVATSLNASLYKQGLDEQDEEFLREHYKELASSLQYDPDSGAVFLDLTSGGNNRKDFRDAPMVSTLERNKYLSFMNTYTEGGEDAQSFMANTKGIFLIPIPFKYRVKVEWDMSIQTMDANGTFNAIVMFNTTTSKKSHYLTNWVHWQSSTRGARPKMLKPVPGEYTKSANYWFIKTRDVGMEVEFKAPAEDPATDSPTEEQLTDSATLTVVYDKRVDPVENVYPSSGPITYSGFVGFQWNRVKFTVKRLKISGILDKHEAVDMLRKITGIKKGKRRAPPKQDEPTGTELDSLLKPKKTDEPNFDF